MSLTYAQMAVGFIGLLHLVFMTGELLPWHAPKIIKVVSGK